MSDGEIAYLALAIGAFIVYACLLAYGIAVASERPEDARRAARAGEPEAVKKAA